MDIIRLCYLLGSYVSKEVTEPYHYFRTNYYIVFGDKKDFSTKDNIEIAFSLQLKGKKVVL